MGCIGWLLMPSGFWLSWAPSEWVICDLPGSPGGICSLFSLEGFANEVHLLPSHQSNQVTARVSTVPVCGTLQVMAPSVLCLRWIQNFFFFFFFWLFGPHSQHMEVPRLGVKSELQLPTYTTAYSNTGSLTC